MIQLPRFCAADRSAVQQRLQNVNSHCQTASDVIVSFAWCPAVMSSLRLPEPNCSAYTLRPKAVRVSVLT